MEEEVKKKGKGGKVVFIIVLFILGVVALLAVVYIGSLLKMRKNAQEIAATITEDTFRQSQTSIVYDINGNEIANFSGVKESYYVEFENIPQILKDTFIAIEDKDFYSHGGIDFFAIIRASLANLNAGTITQGASTITQQLAKTMFLTSEQTYERKITEMFLAFELESKFSKDQILEFYINNIYYGNGYYGIEAAAQGYFGLSTNLLDISQTAFVAGIPKSPLKYDPITNYDACINRRDSILMQLFASGLISSLDYYAAIEEELTISGDTDTVYNYVETYVMYCATRALMENEGFIFQTSFEDDDAKAVYEEAYNNKYAECQQKLFNGGYRIYTAIDMSKQSILQDCVNKALNAFTDTNEEGIYKMQGAAVCIDNDTGFVTAIVGGRSQDYDGYTLNRAYQSYRQPGSAIKPLIVYTPYLMLGHNPNDTVLDAPIDGGPVNFTGEYLGEISLTHALGISSNVAAWRIFQEETPAYGMSFLHKMKFARVQVDDNRQAAAIGGFTYGVSPVEMASAYATLENNGVYRTPTCVEMITDSIGNKVIDNSTAETVQAYSETESKMITKMMEYGVNHYILTGAKIPEAIVAAKSGTTNDSKDGWLCGYSRYYTTAVWCGMDMPASVEGLSGGSYPLEIWRNYMREIHKDLALKEFPPYDSSSGIIDDSETQNENETTGAHPGHPDGEATPNMDGPDADANIDGRGDQDAR